MTKTAGLPFRPSETNMHNYLITTINWRTWFTGYEHTVAHASPMKFVNKYKLHRLFLISFQLFLAFYRKLSGEIQLWKSKLQLKFADTQQALKLLFFDRSLKDCYKWTLRNKIIHTEVIFWKIYLKTQMFLYSNEIRLFQRNVTV